MLTTKKAVERGFIFLVLSAFVLSGCKPPAVRSLFRGKEHLDRGEIREALAEFKVAASALSTNAQAWNYLGLAYHYAGYPTNAVQGYQKALVLDHDLAEAHYNLGYLWLEQGHWDLARSELTTYTSLRKNSIEGWLKLGVAQLHPLKVPGIQLL